MTKKCFVSGSFDLLHSGHVAFFKEASEYGHVYVAIGSDKTIEILKGKTPINNEQERLFVVKSNKYVKDAFISCGTGIIDFEEELKNLKPDIFIVNEDGNYKEKEELCKSLGIEYIVLKREPFEDLKARSSTQLKGVSSIPYRIDAAGGWLDQPFLSKIYPGNVITFPVEPIINFNERSGMASSTRKKAIELWQYDIPVRDFQKTAKILFCYDNPPGTEEISGAQDSIGIVVPGISRHYYEGKYWPTEIESTNDEKIISWLENHIYLIPLMPRFQDYDVLSKTNINSIENVKALADAAEDCWNRLIKMDLSFGESFQKSFEAQIKMFPLMINDDIKKMIDEYKNQVLGMKISGAGGGGYMILFSDKEVKNCIKIKIRRKQYYDII